MLDEGAGSVSRVAKSSPTRKEPWCSCRPRWLNHGIKLMLEMRLEVLPLDLAQQHLLDPHEWHGGTACGSLLNTLV